MNSRSVISAVILVIVLSVPVASMVADTAYAEDDDVFYDFTSYYDQLTDNEKAIYDALKGITAENLTASVILKTPYYYSDSTLDSISRGIHISVMKAAEALKMSDPLAICTWGYDTEVSTSFVSSANGSTSEILKLNLFVTMDPDYADDPKTEVNELQLKVDELNAALAKFSTNSTSVRDIAGEINGFVTSNVIYDPNLDTDKESPYAHDAYGALASSDHYAVCDGYSKAFQILCNMHGVTSIVAEGYSNGTEAHAWNYVKMDNGKWYGMDVTWNDTSSNAYLLVGESPFAKEHSPKVLAYLPASPTQPIGYVDFMYPTLAENKYDADPWYSSQYVEFALIAAIGIVIVVGILLAVREDKKKKNL